MRIPDIASILIVCVTLGLLVWGLIRGSKGMRLACGCVLLLILLGLFLPSTRPDKYEIARRIQCKFSLLQIGQATKIFQEEHSNSFPTSILDLTNTLPDPRLFICASTRHKPGAFSNILVWTDYVFQFPPSDNEVLAYCRPGNHKRAGGNILFADGTVQWFAAEAFTAVLKYGRRGAPKRSLNANSNIAPQSNTTQQKSSGVTILEKVIVIEKSCIDIDQALNVWTPVWPIAITNLPKFIFVEKPGSVTFTVTDVRDADWPQMEFRRSDKTLIDDRRK